MADEQQNETKPVEADTPAQDKAGTEDAQQTAPSTETAAPAPPPAEEAGSTPGTESAAEGDTAAAEKPKRGRRGGRHIPVGMVHIQATFNNTIVTVTDARGATISWSSGGKCGFKGSRKSTAYAATVIAQEAARAANASVGMREVEVCVQGPGAGRESAIRAIQSVGMTVTAIRDVTPVPHNGCRPPKRRRV